MKLEPIWNIKTADISFKSLDRKISVDVAIIGGGITGITTAQFLSNYGLKVAVLEARKVGQGTTGQSTGNLYALTEFSLQELKNKYDLATVQKIILARIQAVEHICDNAKRFAIDCDLKTQPMFMFEKENGMDIEKEIEVLSHTGLAYSRLTKKHFPFPYEDGFVVEDQAQFNPLRYTEKLAKQIYSDTCEIFEDTCVSDIVEEDEFLIVHANENRVKARYVVHATHTPKGLLVQYHTTLGPYREYGIGVKLKNNNYPEGIFWGHFGDKKFSVRTYGLPSNPYLICVGSMHKVGQAGDNTQNIQELEDFVKKHFDVESIIYKWGGQNYKPADLLPYIGQKNAGSNEYIATGFATDGLVYGTLAAKIISDEIAGLKNEYSELFKASRHQPLKAAEKFTKENINVVGKLVGDFFKKGEDEQIADLLPDEGKLLQYEDGKYAVYKNHRGEVTALSPICPHMGCTVNWNKAEKTWDCPCHGSRFDTAGRVIEGPALSGLKKIENDK
ncbi:FAD-dependent oxidoreductase [Aequorivita sp. H23M31]|uniref:FAD-dependent oxidoreductase n=1 Tax=Aequorivita ciconiae TaxID=2494375 RepID=A0A410G384_9FLAO|nr:FAD-dependent oxidoreductase [Aequorivita sp. H23M31]QAA81713.1 FAD-dependent oxidoreductase [Aequorivita sp. H23M31]